MKIDEFIKELSKLNINISNQALSQLETYYKELLDYNKTTNLTTITKKEDVYLKHFFDSITITKIYDFDKEVKVLDLGSGAGFPGVVLKIIFPKIKLFLLDSNNKKTTFLSMIYKRLELNDVVVVNKRAEEYIKECRENFDVVISRAVAKIRVLCEIGLPYLKNNGKLIMMKGSKIITDGELKEALPTIELLNSRLEKVESFILPFEESERNIVVIKKITNIDKVYPRSYDKILKKPLKYSIK